MLSRDLEVNCYRLKLAIYIKTLIFAVLLSRDQKKLSIAFYAQIDSQTKAQNSIMEAYFRVFIN